MNYDMIVVGGGPAGLTAALYACRAGKKVLVIEKNVFGGQITYSPKVENIPGFREISGNAFAENLVDQVLAQGTDVEAGTVVRIENRALKTVVTEDGEFSAKTVVIATGARHRLLGLPGEEALIGNGISFCAVCDGAFFRDRTVAVVGGGNSALQEALLLADTAKQVYVVQNLEMLTGEKRLQQQLRERDNVEILYGTVVSALYGKNMLTGVQLRTERDGTLRDLELDGLFIAIGLEPQNEPFSNLLRLDSRGYIDAHDTCMTGTDGIFAAGDCRVKKIRQVTTAASDGAIAALAACDYLDAWEEKSGN